MKSAELLFDTIADPRRALSLQAEQWNLLLRLARRSALLPRLGWRLGERGLTEELPAKVRDQLEAVALLAAHHNRTVRWEMNRLARALQTVDVKTVLLKGAAYVMAELPVAGGRLVSDVDILVPRDSLDSVERALREHGWEPLNSDEYDDHYYRTWMHELPPLRHRERGIVIDVHHTILPPTGRVHPDPGLLLASARPLAGRRFFVLAPEDMVLHSAAHLFQDGDLACGLRDVTDLDMLFRHFGETDGFWERLVPRARQLQLSRPLYYALRFTRRLLKTSVPPNVLRDIDHAVPRTPLKQVMDQLVLQALVPHGGEGEHWDQVLARFLLYVRSHWLRMPPWLLARHLSHKMLRHWSTQESARPRGTIRPQPK